MKTILPSSPPATPIRTTTFKGFILIYAKTARLAGRNIYIDRFSSFTGDEHMVIRALLEEAGSVTVSLSSFKGAQGFQFASSEETIDHLEKMADELGCPHTTLVLSPDASKEAIHLEENLFSYSPEPYTGETDYLSLFTADSIYSEVNYVARTIRSLVRSGEADYSSISVVCRDSETYAPLLRSIFRLMKFRLRIRSV